MFALCSRLMQAIVESPKPFIAQVPGLATAAGAQLVASCDVVFAGDSARFATPGVNIGLFCSTPAVAIARSMSRKKAMAMLLHGEPISARDAERAGLVTYVVADADLEGCVLDFARKVAAKPADVVAFGKRTFYRQVRPGAARELAARGSAVAGRGGGGGGGAPPAWP